MKVHLVFPAISQFGFATWGAPGDTTLISHGLASLAAACRQAGHEVTLSDLRVCTGWDEFREELRRIAPRVVGISMLTCDFDPALEAARIAKELDPEVVVVVGGPHPSLLPEELEAHPEVDVIFRGEGEVTFPQLLEKIAAGEPLPRVVQGEPPDLDTIPFAARDLFPGPEKYVPLLELPEPMVSIIAGRGCRYNCSFCQPAERLIFGKKVRRRSVENVIAELRMLREQCGFRSLMIHDDCLTEDPEWVREFCRRYREEGFDAPFLCQTRADLVCRDPELVRTMRDAGLAWFIIGFESGNDRVLHFLRKGVTLQQNLEAARLCRRFGLKIWANYMMGLPTETKPEVRDTVRMIRKIRPDICSPAFYTPHPGSDLFDYCRERNLSLATSHSNYARYATSPKLAGLDYVFLERMSVESMGYTSRMADRLSYLSRRMKVPASVRLFFKQMLVRKH